MGTHLKTDNFPNRVLQNLPMILYLLTILILFLITVGQYPPPGQGAGGFGQPYPPQQQPQYGGQPYGAGPYPPQNTPQYSQGPLPYPPGGAGYPAQAPGYPQAPQTHVGGGKHGGAIAAATGTVLPTVQLILKST